MKKVFQNKLVKGLAIGAQPTFCDDANLVQDILQNIEVLPPLKLDKNGIDWRLSVDGGAGANSAVSQVVNNKVGFTGLVYDIRWNTTSYALEVQRTEGGDWETLVQFRTYDT